MLQRTRSHQAGRVRLAAGPLLLFVLLGWFASAPAAAQDALGISPTSLDLGVIGAGGVAVAELTVVNGGDQARSVDLSLVGDEAGWFSLHRSEAGALAGTDEVDLVILDPDGSTTVHIRVVAPDDVAATVGNASVRVVERSDASNVLLGAEVPMRVTVVGAAEIGGAIVSVDAPAADEGQPAEIRVRVVNSGTTAFVATIEAGAVSGDGAVATATSLPRAVSVGDAADVSVVFADGLTAGDHMVTLDLVVDGERLDRSDLSFSVRAAAVTDDGDETELDRPGDNRGVILIGSAVLVLVMIGGAMLVARDEAGPHDGRPDVDDQGRPRRGEAEGRHTARTAEEAWPHRR